MIVIYATHALNDNISSFSFIFSRFWFFRSLGQKWSKMTKNSVRHARYLMNHTSYNCHLCCTCVKWWYLQVFFSNFKILIFCVVRGRKGKKWSKMTKTFVCSTLFFKNHISYDLQLWYTCMHGIYAYMYACMYGTYDFPEAPLLFSLPL